MEAGATHERVADALPRTPDTDVGASGVVAGITADDADDDGDDPRAFVAVTENV